ncbi:hypothetical protein [Pseudomonas protegens]|uniref:hypothetical protein n=1 Tax=Pseudomonas protegens TaxID=380021 RepID=UPI0009C33C87|nr:hypothetical protein [Pseudomonas protegens]AQT10331.1 putative bacteriophage protein [Pseudomonas protegens]GED73318.1 hypothetical protein PFL02_01680 [Pseudomonas fluorescens]
MPEIKERPILLVRAILEGRKTVTRRPVKGGQIPAEDAAGNDGGPRWSAIGQRHPRYGYCVFGETEAECARELAERGVCPYGRPGDRLWVRESLGYDCEYGHYFGAGGKHGETVYLCSLFDDEHAQAGPSYDGLLPEQSVPSIHLHRRYSRILLEITDVRVERLQDISEEQALAEGIVGVAFRPDDGFPICTGYMVGPDDGKSVLEPLQPKPLQSSGSQPAATGAPTPGSGSSNFGGCSHDPPRPALPRLENLHEAKAMSDLIKSFRPDNLGDP